MMPPAAARPLSAAARRDRAVVLAGIALLAALAWAYTIHLALAMDSMAAVDGMTAVMTMPETVSWGGERVALTVAMWFVMMVAMMLPSATPYLLIFARVNRSRRDAGDPYAPTALFSGGYLAAWAVFSLAASGAQMGLESLLLLDMNLASTSVYVGGGLLVLAGLYQWTPWKYTCLANCRSPFSFIAHHWRDGRFGAFTMGFHHGLYCLGCCWAVMMLLFVLGVMNLVWVAALAVFVLLEKVAPRGPALARLSGLAMALAGVALMVTGA